jgi:uncharacterized protein (TIGR02444 family)
MTEAKKKTVKPKAARKAARPGSRVQTPERPTNPFWDFSLKVYAGDGIAPACLALQDGKGMDVNLLLFCCWAGLHGRSLKTAEMESLIAEVAPWRTQVIEPLRAVRRQLRAEDGTGVASSPLRTYVKAAELEAEAVQQRILFEALPLEPGVSSARVASENLSAYARLLKVDCDSTVTADLAAVLRGAFPLLAPLEAVWTLI